MKVSHNKYILNFKQPSGTSRGVIREKETFFIEISDGKQYGIGECSLFRGLSFDDVPDFEDQLKRVCRALEDGADVTSLCADYPAIRMGVEMALKSFDADEPFLLYDTHFSKGAQSISINGLVWMGNIDFMRQQVYSKIDEGYDCIKLKIGALNFNLECQLLEEIRARYSSSLVSLRVDANGVFKPEEALEKLEKLSEYELHSIEQPIAAGQFKFLKKLCAQTPIPIALDEDLIGVLNSSDKEAMLDEIQPQYIILKPSLLGGFAAAEEWIKLAKARNIGWWITSALESNVGLNAIAQWTATLNTSMPQGLGTGELFTNNIESPLVTGMGTLQYNNKLSWNIKHIK